LGLALGERHPALTLDVETVVTDAATLSQQMLAAKRDLEAAQAEHVRCVHDAAEKDRTARIAKASAYLSASGTVQERQAHADQATADVVYAAKLSDGLERSALEAIRNRRQILSALQSLAAAQREEAHLARYMDRELENAR
jgi:hypothetical protein